MQFPLQFGIGSYTISAHLVFETLAFFIGFRYYLYLKKNRIDKISHLNRYWIIIGAIFGAFFFSRFIATFENPAEFFQAKFKILYFYTNKTIVGGLLGGLFAVEATKILLKEKHSSGDLFTFPLILAMIIGRIGCFTSGVYEQTYGVQTASFFGMNLGDGVLRHPVALYEIVFLVLLFAFLRKLSHLKPRKLKEGMLFQFFMITYLTFRFFIEFIKPHIIVFMGLSTIQLACLFGLIYYFSTIYNLFIQPKKLLENEYQY